MEMESEEGSEGYGARLPWRTAPGEMDRAMSGEVLERAGYASQALR
jgi:hypothetical protein